MVLDYKSKRVYVPILITLQIGIMFFIYNVNEQLRVVSETPRAQEVAHIAVTKCLSENGELVDIKVPGSDEDKKMQKTDKDKNEENDSFFNAVIENAAIGTFNNDSEPERELCSEFSENLLGEMYVDLESEPDCLEDIMMDNPLVQNGGSYSPECKARSKAAIVIPFRKRDQHLLYFLQYMHPVLQRQQIEYKIFVINQDGDETFNKDKLMNIGFVEALKEDFHCFIFHDVDLILTNDRCIYQCQSQPVHFAHNVDKFDGLVYNNYFGGAVGLSESQFRRINGFPNNFLGWGGEDDVIFERVVATGMSFFRHNFDFAKYKMVRHERDEGNEVNEDRFLLLQTAKQTYTEDGLNTLPLTYKILDRFEHPLFTKITVDVNYHQRHVKRRSVIKQLGQYRTTLTRKTNS